MIAIVWRYRVRREHAAAFERAYGPRGDWARLFSRHPFFLGTELLHDAEAGDYLTIDRWRDEEDFHAFMRDHRRDYRLLDAACEPLTIDEMRVGMFVETG